MGAPTGGRSALLNLYCMKEQYQPAARLSTPCQRILSTMREKNCARRWPTGSSGKPTFHLAPS